MLVVKTCAFCIIVSKIGTRSLFGDWLRRKVLEALATSSDSGGGSSNNAGQEIVWDTWSIE